MITLSPRGHTPDLTIALRVVHRYEVERIEILSWRQHRLFLIVCLEGFDGIEVSCGIMEDGFATIRGDVPAGVFLEEWEIKLMLNLRYDI